MAEKIRLILIFFPVFLFSLSFHESAHAFMAHKRGDDTAKLMGRMTLNPWPHIDLVGTILFPLMMFLMPGLLLFGWAKPVPVNPYNLKGGRRGHLWVAAAGPISNFLLAIVFAAGLHGLVRYALPSQTTLILHEMLQLGVFLNLMLAFFNLIPIPPLDGSGILEGILPARALEGFHRVGRYGFLILILSLYTGILRLLTVPVYGIARLLLP